MEVDVAPLTILPNNSLAELFLTVLEILSFANLKIFIPRENASTGDIAMEPLIWKIRLPSGHFRPIISLNQQARNKTLGVGIICCSHGSQLPK